jgi:hypothetical protein
MGRLFERWSMRNLILVMLVAFALPLGAEAADKKKGDPPPPVPKEIKVTREQARCAAECEDPADQCLSRCKEEDYPCLTRCANRLESCVAKCGVKTK